MLYINGEWRTEGEKLDVIDPATGEVIETVATGGKEETKEAIEHATTAFKEWKNTPGDRRGRYLAKVVRIMRQKRAELAETITKENGKPLADAKGEVASAIAYLEWYAEEAKRVYGDTLPPSHPNKHLMVLREPVGVVGAITPWNFPLSMITRKIAPAIAAGCTVVLKPADQTPLSAIKVFECFHEAELPAGVVNLVIGDAKEIGEELTGNRAVRKIAFTGSTRVGKLLMKQSADTVKKMSMELGGHAPFVIFEDADVDQAVTGVVLSKFRNSGQTCISTNRVYVHESIAEEFATKLAERAAQLKIGSGFDEDTVVGPVIDDRSLEKLSNQVEDAKSHGAKVLHGGNVHTPDEGDGFFFEPTVIQGATEDMLIASEETFGPIAPIFTFKTDDEAIEKANHVSYGLAAYCYTEDLSRGLRMTRELEYGIVGINDAAPVVIQAPFGGLKESGMGNEGGKYGLEEYLVEKFVSIRTKE
ncbi:MAG TPA: NAD-dependent succinate-semialdehyde dehydrogenase [Pseudogracilibacillus sp.]|nr:NAD-dependent succinate-semialdehyde dehydrogenase [Pseudogracilibacillus sp.]